MKIIRTPYNNNEVKVSVLGINTPDISIFYYPYYIRHNNNDFNTIDSDYLVGLSIENLTLEVYEATSRPLSDFPEIVDIIITFISLRVMEGFINELGSDLYSKIKLKLKEIAPIWIDARGKEVKTGMHLCYNKIINGEEIKIKVALRIDELELIGKKPYIIESIDNYIKRMFSKYSIQEILISLIKDDPFWKIEHYISKSGEYVRIK